MPSHANRRIRHRLPAAASTAIASATLLLSCGAPSSGDPLAELCTLSSTAVPPGYQLESCAAFRKLSAAAPPDIRHARQIIDALARKFDAEPRASNGLRYGVALALVGQLDHALTVLDGVEHADSIRPALDNDLATVLVARSLRAGHADDRFAALQVFAAAPSASTTDCNHERLRSELGLRPRDSSAVCGIEGDRHSLAPIPETDVATDIERRDLDLVIDDPQRTRELIGRSVERWQARLFEVELPRLVRERLDPQQEHRIVALSDTVSDLTGDDDAAGATREVRAHASSQTAGALREFARGQAALREYAVETALTAFRAAHDELRRSSPTLGDWTDAGIATCLYYRRDLTAADGILGRLETIARADRRPGLLARALWLRSNVALEQGLTELAAHRAEESVRLYAEGKQHRHEAAMRSILAGALFHVGERQSAAKQWQAALKIAVDSGYAARVPVILSSIARSQARMGRFAGATELQQEAYDRDVELGDPLGVAESALTLARYESRLGDWDQSRELLARAHSAAGSVQSLVQRTKTLQLIALAEAESSCQSRPNDDSRSLDRALVEWRRHGFLYLLPEALLARASCRSGTGDVSGAIADFDAALDERTAQEKSIQEPRSRALWLDQSRDALDEVADLLIGSGDVAGAFARLELLRRGRSSGAAQSWLGPNHGPASSLPDLAVCVLAFLSLPDRLVRGQSCDGSWSFSVVDARRDRIERLVDAMVGEMSRADRGIDSPELAQLARWIFGGTELPARRNHLVVVPDGPLSRLPFAALLRSARGDSALASVSIEVSPSITVAHSLDLAAAREPRVGARSALVLAAPALRPELTASYPTLSGAAREGSNVAALMPGSELLTGAGATRGAFLAGAERHSILHIAAHIVADRGEPLGSRVLTAPDATGDALAASDLAALQTPAQLAFLGGCESGRGYESRLLGTVSLGHGLLAAGVPQVVATLWPVDDRTAERFDELFYTELLSGRTAVDALRAAQLTAMRSPDAELAAPRTWAAYQLLGGGGAAERR